MSSQINWQELLEKLPPFLKDPNPELFLGDNYVVIDFETTNIRKGSPYEPRNQILFTAWKLGPEHPDYSGGVSDRVQYLWGSEFSLGRLIRSLERSAFIVAHHSKFELGWLERAGLSLERTLAYCTLLGEYVVAGNRKFDLSLECTLNRYGLDGKESLVSKLIKAGVCPSEIPRPWLKEYGCGDVEQTEKLFLLQREKLRATNLLAVHYTRCIFTNPLVAIQRKGMALDKSRVEKVHKKFTSEVGELQRRFEETFGGINTNSPPQKIELIYNQIKFPVPKDRFGRELRTDKGNLQTGAEIIPLLKAKTKKQKLFKKLISNITNLSSALSKNLTKMALCLEETAEGIITFVLNQAVTMNHRLASNGANYSMQGQNIPRAFKPLFKARKPGWSIGEWDYAQLEYKIACFLGNDSVGIRSIQEGVDRHAETSRILTGAGQPTNRQDAKSHTFKPLFGGTSGTKAERTYYESFRQEHRELTETQLGWCEEVVRTGTLRTITGLTFYWPDTRVTGSGYITNSNNIKNYPISMFAGAEVVPIGVTYQWHLLRLAGLESFLVNTIHDSSIGEVAPGEEEDYAEISDYAMVEMVIFYLKEVYGIVLDTVPLSVEGSFNEFWNDSPKWREEYL